MTKKIFIMVGVAGSGKDYYIDNRLKRNDYKISSDNLRMELFGELLENKENNSIVFKEMLKRTKSAIKNENIGNIYYNATNLNRKKRIHLYTELKTFAKKNNVMLEVEIVCILKSLNTIIEQNNKREEYKRMPEYVILKMYKVLQIPKIGVDCDVYTVITESYDRFIKEYQDLDIPHDTPYHKESVLEHIELAKKNAKHYSEDKILYDLAATHDLGKIICKKFRGEYANYIGHENVGAFYYLAKLGNKTYTENLLIPEVILHHIMAHNGISPKIRERNKLTETELYYIEELRKIDEESRY